MTITTLSRRSFHVLATFVLALTLAACSGGSGSSASPSDPSGSSMVVLSTSWGDLAIQTHGHPVDLDRALRSVNEGYSKGRSQVGSRVDGFRLDGYLVTVMPASWELNGQHLRSSREIRMRAGKEGVLEHELQHVFAWELERFADCRTYQDHPGGYDLNCGRRG